MQIRLANLYSILQGWTGLGGMSDLDLQVSAGADGARIRCLDACENT